ncbi:MAG TPA: hypothetical protein QF753_08635 [Victivallales bacterium]|nr:hypothetical protein [Victivallales bacterium]
MVNAPLENIIKELYLLTDRKNIVGFSNRIVSYEQQFYSKAELCIKIASHLNNVEDDFINMSIKYRLYLDIIRNENELVKEVWPELYNYFMNEF